MLAVQDSAFPSFGAQQMPMGLAPAPGLMFGRDGPQIRSKLRFVKTHP